MIGLICAALGIKRDDDEMVSQLATLRFGVRVDKEGHFVRDFHMVRSKRENHMSQTVIILRMQNFW